MSSSGLVDNSHRLEGSILLSHAIAAPAFIDGPRTTQLVLGNKQLKSFLAEIRHLRRECGQEDDLTVDPEYFIAANTLADRKCAAVLIRRDRKLEACVLFYEHCKFGVGLGLLRGGDYIGESLIVGPEVLRVHYAHLASLALLKRWGIHGVSLSIKAPLASCIEIMGPASNHRRFSGSEVRHKLPLKDTYEGMLASLGPRTRRSLAGKRQQLEKSTSVKFVPVLEPDQALEVMLGLEAKTMPQRIKPFFHARYGLLRTHSGFFSMGMRLPEGPWLSLVSGWRRSGVTYVDIQMNDMHYKKESISAVMRAFLLEYEIGLGQKMLNFVGGSSLLLRRYCEPIEPCTEMFFWKPCLQSKFFELVAKRVKSGSVYERLKPGANSDSQSQPAEETEN